MLISTVLNITIAYITNYCDRLGKSTLFSFWLSKYYHSTTIQRICKWNYYNIQHLPIT